MTDAVYLDRAQTTEAAIRARMLEAFPPDLDTSEGSFPWDTTAPAVIELVQVAIAAARTLDRGFAQTTPDKTRLVQRADEHGVNPPLLSAAPAKVTLRFTAPAGTAIPLGTRVSTAGSAAGVQVFATDAAAVVGVGQTTVDVAATAEVAGTRGNVAVGSLTFLASPVAGVIAVTNPAAATGGLDEEGLEALRTRYLAKVRNPSAGGNRADYVNWALAVPGVGGVTVSFPGEGAPAVAAGNVRLALIGTDKTPASLAVQDAVLTRIVDPRRLGPYEAEAFALSGFGATVDGGQLDDSGDSVLFVHHGSGDGQATQPGLRGVLAQPGVWTLRLRPKVSSTAGAIPFLRFGVWNTSAGTWAKSSPSAADGTAFRDLRANELATAFPDATYELLWPSVDFYDDGVSVLEARVIRINASGDAITQVWLDRVRYRSAFSSSDGAGLAPAGARVHVAAATPISVSVVATVTYMAGYVKANVDAAIAANLDAYLKSLAFGANNDVQYARVGVEILDTPGVADYAGLSVNGGTVNIVIGAEQVATLGTVVLA